MKEEQAKPGADTDSDHNLLIAKICIGLKKMITFERGNPRWELETMLNDVKCEIP
jgi:hypothetical protein